MTERERPMKKTVKASEARQQLPQLLNTVYRGDTRVLVERSGIPVAAIVSARDLEELTRLDQQRAESVIGLYKAELVYWDGPWKGADDLELATLTWVDWFNRTRLHSALGHRPPAEVEAEYYRHNQPAEQPLAGQRPSDKPGAVRSGRRVVGPRLSRRVAGCFGWCAVRAVRTKGWPAAGLGFWAAGGVN